MIVLGTTGECATLSDADYRTFVTCVIETVDRRIPTFVGATALGGHEVHRRLDFVREKGADGTLLGLPMWQPVTDKMAVDYYAAVSEAFPDLALKVYANQRAFRFSFAPDFWAAVAKAAPTVLFSQVEYFGLELLGERFDQVFITEEDILEADKNPIFQLVCLDSD